MKGSSQQKLNPVAQGAMSRRLAPAAYDALNQYGCIIEAALGQGVIAFWGDGRYAYLSRQAESLLREGGQELLGRCAFDLIHLDDLPGFLSLVLQGPNCSSVLAHEFRHRVPPGGYRWFGILRLAAPEKEAFEGLRLYALRDITGVKEPDSTMSKSQVTLSFLQSIGSIGAWIWDVVHNRIEWSSQVALLFQVEERRPSLELIRKMVHPEDLSVWEETLAESIKAQRAFSFDCRYIRGNGEEIWTSTESQVIFQEDGSFFGFRGTVQDITARKKAEEEVVCQREELRIIYDNSPIMMCLLDDKQTILYANPIFSDFSEKHTESLEGERACTVLGCLDALDEARRDAEGASCENCVLRRGIATALETGGEQLNLEHTLILMQNGEKKRVHLQGSATLLPRPEGRRILLCLQNVTERKNAEERLLHYQNRLRSLAAELVQSEDRERRRIAIYLHDRIGQSLAAIRMKLGAFRNRYLKAEDASFIEDVEGTVNRAIEETRLLTFEISPPLLFELGLGPALEWVGERLTEENGIAFRFNDDGRIDPLDDLLRSALYRIGRELILNVVKHAGASRIELSVRRIDTSVQLIVEDDGVCMPACLIDERSVATAEHFGLFSIKEQIIGFAGRLEITQGSLGGTHVLVSVPLQAGNEER